MKEVVWKRLACVSRGISVILSATRRRKKHFRSSKEKKWLTSRRHLERELRKCADFGSRQRWLAV